MDILFIGVACTEQAIKQSNEKYYKGRATVRPQQYFDFNLVSGLAKFANVMAISQPPVASYPNSNCLWYNRKNDKVFENLQIKYISLFNLLGIKSFIIMITIFFETLKFCIKNRNNKSVAILLGYLSFYTSFPAILISKIFKVKVFTVVPDVPKYMNEYTNNNSIIRNYLNNVLEALNKITDSRFDGYIFLTKYMDYLLNRNNKPFIVMEGFINKEEIPHFEEVVKEPKNIIMYAGTLHEKFGVRKLVEAFKLMESTDCELWIFGEGDYLNSIQKESANYGSIIYKGTRSRKEILRIEREVTLLVNPRPSDEDFTKYSFPSKTIEYMASGTPLLTTRLAGIPEEYFKFLYVFENEEIPDMAVKMKSLLNLPNNELNCFGLKAKEFIEKYKTNCIQAERVYEFLVKNI